MKRPYIKYIASLLLFGSNGIVASQISLSSYHIVLMRTLIGSIFLLLVYLVVQRTFSFYKYPKDLLYISGSGVAMGLCWIFLYEAYSQIGVSIASLLYYTGPVIVMVLAPLIFKERLTAAKVIGFITVFCGVLLVNGGSSGQLNAWGVICGCMSAVMLAVLIITNKKAENITGIENSLLQLISSFLTVAVFVGLKNGGYSILVASKDWLWILLLGVLNTGIGCYLYFSSISYLPVQTVAILGYLEPLSAVVLSIPILGESMLPLQAVGASLILGGALFGECVKESPRKRIGE